MTGEGKQYKKGRNRKESKEWERRRKFILINFIIRNFIFVWVNFHCNIYNVPYIDWRMRVGVSCRDSNLSWIRFMRLDGVAHFLCFCSLFIKHLHTYFHNRMKPPLFQVLKGMVNPWWMKLKNYLIEKHQTQKKNDNKAFFLSTLQII